MADGQTNYATAEAAAESVLGFSFIPLRQQGGASPAVTVPAAVHYDYDAPVIHAVHTDADLPIIHDPYNGDVTAAQAAIHAIAASASAYNIPTTGIIADSAFAGYAVDQTHNAHDVYHASTDTAAAHHNATAGMEYMALAASTAMTGTTPPTTTMNNYTNDGAHVEAQEQQIQHQQQAQAQQIQHHQQSQAQAQQTQPHQEQPTIPETAFLQQCTNGRQTMNMLIKEQKQALIDLNIVEEEFARAQERLATAKQHKISVDERVKANTESLTEELIQENTRWNDMYKRMAEYKQQHGHCHVMRNPKRNKSVTRKKNSEKVNLQSLGTWVGQVRVDARRPVGHPERLEPYKIVALDRLGFDWEPRENYWMDMLEQLKIYLEKSGGRMPPRFINNQKFALGQWCDTQSDNYRKFNGGKKVCLLSIA